VSVIDARAKFRHPGPWGVSYELHGHPEQVAGPYPTRPEAEEQRADIAGYDGVTNALVIPLPVGTSGWSTVQPPKSKDERKKWVEAKKRELGLVPDNEGDATCQQCRESYKLSESSAETFRRFCSRTCEDTNDAELYSSS
jgi:hypothetical protein